MLSIAWFLALGTVFQQSEPASLHENSLKFYQQAAASLQADDPLKAIPALEQLLNTDADSKLAPVAAVRLAECLLSAQKHIEAVQLLLTWTPRVLQLTEQDFARRLDTGIVERATFLTRSALAQLPEANNDLLERLVSEAQVLTSANDLIKSEPAVLGPVQGWMISELARRYANQNRHAESYQLLIRLGALADAREQKLREFDLPVAILLNQPTQEMIVVLSHSVESSTAWSMTEVFSAKMALAEGLRKLGNLDAANSSLEQLASWLNQQKLMNTKSQSTELADWQATVDLRRVELMIQRNQYKQAAQLVDQCLKDYSSYPDLVQFRFIAARCLIAEVDFERAGRQLQTIIDSTASSPSQIAQATWMLGELGFLQRDYVAAIERYQQVLKIGDQPKWHARALVQMAKCYELQAAPLDALAAYQAVVNSHPNSELVESARARLEQLANWSESQTARSTATQTTESKLPTESQLPTIQR